MYLLIGNVLTISDFILVNMPLQPVYHACSVSLLAAIFMDHESGDKKDTKHDVFAKHSGCKGTFKDSLQETHLLILPNINKEIVMFEDW